MPYNRDQAELVDIGPSLMRKMIEVRRHLHRHPEISNEERGTQAYLKAQLQTAGLEGIREVAGFGLSVDILGTGGHSNRKVAVRADIDALPINETSGVPFSSEYEGVMHACGHDAHTAMVFAAALHLNTNRDQFAGVVRFIFQPAEEAEPTGGRRVLEEGLLDDIDNAIGIHVDPYLATGKIAAAAGPYTLASDRLDITVSGSSAHAAKPSEGVDAIVVACSIIAELQKIVSREVDPFDPLVVSITAIQGGDSYNVITDRVHIKGTIRSGHDETRHRAAQRVRQIAEHVASAHLASADVQILSGEPAVLNDAEMTQVFSKAASKVVGTENVLPLPGWTAADDFSFYSSKRPSVYFRLGIRNDAVGSTYPLHHPRFRVDEDALPLGAQVLCAAALEFLRHPHVNEISDRPVPA